MSETTLVRGRVAAGMAVVAGTIGLVAAMPASATSGEPEKVDGNPTCGVLAPEGVEWTEYKLDPVSEGTHGDGTLEVTITLGHDGGQTFDWTSNIGVDAVFAKGGNGGNLYTYDESTGDTGLHAPKNASGKYAGLSHISFCYDPDGTTPTTPTTDVTITPNTSVPDTPAPDVDITPNTTVPGTETTTPSAGAPVAQPAQAVIAQPTYTG